MILHNPGGVERVQHFDVPGIAEREQVLRLRSTHTVIRPWKANGHVLTRTDKPEAPGDRGIEESA